MTHFKKSIFGIAAALCLVGAQADTLYTAGKTGEMPSPDSIHASFSAGAGAGLVSVRIQGYDTLDGDNHWIDIFHISINGSRVFAGTWNLGGSGSDRVLLSPTGTKVDKHKQKRTVDLDVPVSLVDGTNTVTFAYNSPYTFEGKSRSGPEGLDNEGWGLNYALITGKAAVVAAVPEPETYAMLLVGLGALGFMARRHSAVR